MDWTNTITGFICIGIWILGEWIYGSKRGKRFRRKKGEIYSEAFELWMIEYQKDPVACIKSAKVEKAAQNARQKCIPFMVALNSIVIMLISANCNEVKAIIVTAVLFFFTSVLT